MTGSIAPTATAPRPLFFALPKATFVQLLSRVAQVGVLYEPQPNVRFAFVFSRVDGQLLIVRMEPEGFPESAIIRGITVENRAHARSAALPTLVTGDPHHLEHVRTMFTLLFAPPITTTTTTENTP